jgi:quinol monooxygenase YgiN
MITVWIQLKAKPGNTRALKAVLLKAITQGKGLLRYELFHQADDEAKFSILETFVSQEAIDNHYLTEHYISWRQEVDKLIEEGFGTDYTQIYSSLLENV